MEVELEVPGDTLTGLSLDEDFVAWWLTALLRLRVGPTFQAAVMGEQPLEEARANAENAVYRPIETSPRTLRLTPDAARAIGEVDVAWLAKYWVDGSRIYLDNGRFQLLFNAVDQCMFAGHRDLALLWLWGGLEAVFSPDKVELRYRTSSNIASFLEPSGLSRLSAQKVIAKLYDSRSAAAHGREDKVAESLVETYSIARRAVVRMLEDSRVPTHAELEAKLFGADPE